MEINKSENKLWVSGSGSYESSGTMSLGVTNRAYNPREGVFKTAREIAEYHLSHKTDADKLEYDILRYLERQISLNIKA